ncbi:MAG: 50S ribosomal protein L37ae [Thermoplasmata archaeon]|nr:50S ribosomal protein L37Ae [Thermoplasmata archaeon]RLF30250.1 MAG: 50S ribosomal protein L37ae [Thermoplasmata archaeon]HDJ26739.1 50S ribosomal protein L37Ae [Aciduliprofundum sp.]
MGRSVRKVGPAGSFGPRYGSTLRHMWKKVTEQLRKRYVCPRCGYRAVRRRSTGIWECRHCGFVFAGGAYVPDVDEAWKAPRL